MAKDLELQPVTFYAVHLDGKLKKTMGPISWKWGTKYRDEIDKEIKYQGADEKSIQFNDGIFITSDPDQIEYLRHYTSGGSFKLQDGRTVSCPPEYNMFRITETDPLSKGVKIKKEEVIVQKKVIPEAVLELMTLEMKVAFCKDEGIELPKEVTEESIIRVLKESGAVA